MTTQAERRRQIGADNKSARQASGRAMRDDMRALAENNRPERTLPELPVRGKQPAERGVAEFEVAQSGGGMSGELTELPSTRTYWPAATIIPADGFFFYSVKAVKTLAFNGLTMHLEKPDYGSGEE